MAATFNTFDGRIKGYLDQIMEICKEEGIEYFTFFKINNSQRAHYKSNDMILDADIILEHKQKWELRNKKFL